MQYLVAPTMGERAVGTWTCVDDELTTTPVLTVITLVLQMTACVPIVILLIVVQAAVPACNGCAWGARAVGRTMSPAGRAAFRSICSWRHATYLFYLGTAASWTSSPASLESASDLPIVPARVLAPSSQARVIELARNRPITLVPKRVLVLSGHPSATDAGKSAIGIGDAAYARDRFGIDQGECLWKS